MSKILKRQLRRAHLSEEEVPKDLASWQSFLESIESAYKMAEEDRYLLERSLDLSSKEMREEIERNKKMTLQLAQAGKMVSLGTLASGVAHELNNPLAIIKGFAELIQESEEVSEENQESLDMIIKTSERMAQIIKHMLKLSRQGGEEEESSGELVDLSVPISDVLDLLKRQFSIDQIEVDVRIDAKDTQICGNANTLAGIFQNLFTNSRDAFIANKTSGRISIVLHNPSDSEVEVVYTDNAGGMSEKVLANIFDPFFTTKDVGMGTGLGLSIVKQTVEDMHGKVVVKTEQGKGTTFKLLFPLDSGEKECKNSLAEVEVDVPKVPTKRLRVLLIDDEQVVCDVLEKMLSRVFDVRTAVTGKDGLAIFDKEKFDFVITDLKMPGIPGEQVAKHVREKSPHLPLVFISGHIDDDIHGVLSPFSPHLLIEKPLPKAAKMIELLTNFVEEQEEPAA